MAGHRRWSEIKKLRALKETLPMTLMELEAYAKQIDFDLKVGQAMQNQALEQLRSELQETKDQPVDSRVAIVVSVVAGALAGLEVLQGLAGVPAEFQTVILVAISALTGFLGRHKAKTVLSS